MAFQTKSFVSILASMVNYARSATKKFTDYNIGSKVRTLLEAVANEIEELYRQMVNGLVEAIPTSIYLTFNFPLLLATPTTVTVIVLLDGTTNTAAQVISAGTVCTPANQAVTYAVVNDTAVSAAATSVPVLVKATAAGSIGNTAAGTGFTISPSPIGFVSAANTIAASNGTDLETEASRFQRFTAYIVTLARGTPAALNYAMSLAILYDDGGGITERVKFSQVVEPYLADSSQPVGLVNCYLHNGVGSTSSDLVAAAQNIINGYYTAAGVGIPGYKAAGVKTTAYAAPEQALAVSGTVKTDGTVVEADAVASAEALISSYLLGLALGQTYVVAEVYALLMGIPGVTNWLPSAPTADVTTANAYTKMMPGAIDVTAG